MDKNQNNLQKLLKEPLLPRSYVSIERLREAAAHAYKSMKYCPEQGGRSGGHYHEESLCALESALAALQPITEKEDV